MACRKKPLPLGYRYWLLRDETERPEGIEAGAARLVGTDRDRNVAEVERLFIDREAYNAMVPSTSPYGDGHAAKRIVDALFEYHESGSIHSSRLEFKAVTHRRTQAN